MQFAQKIIGLILIGLISSTVHANEIALRNEIKSHVLFLFLNNEFKELDSLAETYRNPDERTNSGLWKLTIFYSSFGRLTGTYVKGEAYWKSIKDKVGKWITENPRSPSAKIVKGIILKSYAWKFRSASQSHQISGKVWKSFKSNLRVAETHMLRNKQMAMKDPHWYGVTADIKKGLNEDIKTFNELVNEGLDKFPNYYQLYFSAIDYFAPKWYGDKRQIEQFANRAVQRTKSSEGMGMYARIYWYISQTQYNERLFLDSGVVWSKMRAGIYDIIKQYPDSWNIQNFAFLSCLANDEETTRILLDKMSGPMMIQAWKKAVNYDYCRAFAYPDAPSGILI